MENFDCHLLSSVRVVSAESLDEDRKFNATNRAFDQSRLLTHMLKLSMGKGRRINKL